MGGGAGLGGDDHDAIAVVGVHHRRGVGVAALGSRGGEQSIGAPSNMPLTLPSLARNSSMMPALNDFMSDMGVLSGGCQRTLPASDHTPVGCQTVFTSVKARIRLGSGASPSRARCRGRRTRFTFSAASSSRSRPVGVADAGEVDGVHVEVGGQRRRQLPTWPVSRLTTPPGRSEVASTSPRVTAGSGRLSDATTTQALPLTMTGATTDTRPEQRRRLRRDHGDDAGRLGDREVEVRAGHRVGGAVDLGELVGPAGVPDPAVDGGVHRARRRPVPRAPRRRRPRPTNWSRRPSSISATR